MGSLFRSEAMTLCQLFLQSEAAYACVSELGELVRIITFKPNFGGADYFAQRTILVTDVKYCMYKKLLYQITNVIAEK